MRGYRGDDVLGGPRLGNVGRVPHPRRRRPARVDRIRNALAIDQIDQPVHVSAFEPEIEDAGMKAARFEQHFAGFDRRCHGGNGILGAECALQIDGDERFILEDENAQPPERHGPTRPGATRAHQRTLRGGPPCQMIGPAQLGTEPCNVQDVLRTYGTLRSRDTRIQGARVPCREAEPAQTVVSGR